MVGDLCKPINPGEGPVVRIAMTVEEARRLMALIMNGEFPVVIGHVNVGNAARWADTPVTKQLVNILNEAVREAETAPRHCPTCDSPDPHRHPAVQEGGEVQVCGDSFHRTVTAQNTPERIASVYGDKR